MKIAVIIASIGNKSEVESWYKRHELLIGHRNLDFIINNSNQEVDALWDSFRGVKVYHSKKSGILNAFNFLVSKVSEEFDYFIHSGIDDVLINVPTQDYNADLVFIPVIDARFDGARNRVKVRKPFSYYLNNRPYCPHHQGCLYAQRLATNSFYSDFGICFDAHKTLKLLESNVTYIIDNQSDAMFEMWEGGLSSNIQDVLNANNALTKDLKWNPSWGKVLINKLVNKLRYGRQ